MAFTIPKYEIAYDTKAGPDSIIYKGKRLHKSEGPWTLIDNDNTYCMAMHIAKTDYQKEIVNGYANMGGNVTSTGSHSTYRDEYKKIYQAFLNRLRANGIICIESQGKRRARILILMRKSE